MINSKKNYTDFTQLLNVQSHTQLMHLLEIPSLLVMQCGFNRKFVDWHYLVCVQPTSWQTSCAVRSVWHNGSSN